MAQFKSEILLLSILLYLTVCASALRKTSRDVSHLGYLYDKPAHTLEEEEESVEETHVEIHHHTPQEKYLPPKHHIHTTIEEETDTVDHHNHERFVRSRNHGKRSLTDRKTFPESIKESDR